MGLADDVHARPITRWTRPIVDSILGPEDAKELDELLADPAVIVDFIWLTLRERGIGVSEAAVQKWAYMARHR